jgi:membrane protein YdbS with pleckstrin-like domain
MVDIARLRRFRIFDSLTDEELEEYLDLFHEEFRPRNENIFRESAEGDRFYLIESGQFSIRKSLPEGGEQFLGYYSTGEFFGELALMRDVPRAATVDVVTQASLIYMEKQGFLQLLIAEPSVREELAIIGEERERRSRMTFPSKRDDEAIIYMGHRHIIWLLVRTGPAGTLLPVWIALTLLASSFGGIPWWAHLSFVLVFLAINVWFTLDWLNDWFVVTSKRVVHTEKVILFFEKEEEAALEKITNVTSEVRGLIGNFLNMGDVTIHTAAGGGRIEFEEMYRFREIRDAIQMESQRVQERGRVDDIARMRQSIREALHNEFEEKHAPPPAPRREPGVAVREKTGVLGQMFGGISFIPPTRIEKGNGEIIWRKHVLVLYFHIFWPILFFIIFTPLAILLVYGGLFGASTMLPLSWSLILSVLGMTLILIWFWYQYRDWENDIYVLTPDRIVDSMRKPFWLQERVRVATLAQVQNVTFERKNFIQNVFNFGTVTVQTAGTDGNLDFNYVPNPREVHARITEALARFKARVGQLEREQRKREFLDWFGEYNKLKRDGAMQPATTAPQPPPATAGDGTKT